jgi:hypothetical protein
MEADKLSEKRKRGELKMPAPKADEARCDVPGCGALAVHCTDGTEEDIQAIERSELTKRPALKNINVCTRHGNWPHSDDAKAWAATNEKYKTRK